MNSRMQRVIDAVVAALLPIPVREEGTVVVVAAVVPPLPVAAHVAKGPDTVVFDAKSFVAAAPVELLPAVVAQTELQAPEVRPPSVEKPLKLKRDIRIPLPRVVSAERMRALPWQRIEGALHKAYDGDATVAERLGKSLRNNSDHCAHPFRVGGVELLEDLMAMKQARDAAR